MRHLLALVLILFSFAAFAQTETDSTYTTFSASTLSGYNGADTCTHEWFTTISDTETENVRTQITSKQCVKCAKQFAIENKWTTYLKPEENEE